MNQSNNNQLSTRQLNTDITALLKNGISAIPSDINSDRLRLNACMAVKEDEKLLRLANEQPAKVAQIIYNFIIQGLDMLNNECYIIPFGNDLTILKDYKGERKLAMKYSVEPIREIYAREVREGDEYYFDNENKFVHRFDPFMSNEKRGPLIGAFCTVIYKNGVQQTEFVNLDEIEKVKGVSKSANSASSPWKKWEESMFKKTATKKAMKNIALDFGNDAVQQAYKETDNDVDFNRTNKEEVKVQEEVFVEGEIIEQKELPDGCQPQPENEELNLNEL